MEKRYHFPRPYISDSFDRNPDLIYHLDERIYFDADGHKKLSLRFVFSPACGELNESKAVPFGTSVGTFLRTFMRFSKRQISSLKYREDGIRVNGVVQRVSFVIGAGDVLEIILKSAGSLYLDHGTFTEPPDILYEDSDLLIVNKPSGMVCHPSPGHYADTLANQTAAYAAKNKENWSIRMIGRLDKDTSGIVIFAKNSETAARLSTPSAVEKEYFALVEGKLSSASGHICLPISPDNSSNNTPENSTLGKMKIDPDGKPAETIYQTIAEYEGKELFTNDSLPGVCALSIHYSLLRVHLVHGRTHQIRIHLSSIGHPLVGDAMYGNGKKGETHALLHCRRAFLRHPFTGEEIIITAPYPYDWPEAITNAELMH